MPPVSIFPPFRLSESLVLAQTIASKNSGQPMYRADIFAEIKRSPESGAGRQLVTASSQYGLTVGGYKAVELSLGAIGRRIAIDGDPNGMVDAVLNVGLFAKFFERYKDTPVPASVPAKTFLAENGVSTQRTDACLAILLDSGRDCGLIQKIGDVERIVSPDRATQGPARPRATVTKHQDAATEEPTPQSEEPFNGPSHIRMPSMHFNIEVHLPADATAETYDAIFSSMRKHLFDAGE